MKTDYLEPYSFFFELPLYTELQLKNEEEVETIRRLLVQKHRVNAYNPELQEQTTYEISPAFGISYIQGGDAVLRDTKRWDDQHYSEYGGTGFTMLYCPREQSAYFCFHKLDVIKHTITKIGQYPSLADIHLAGVKDYSKVLSRDKLKEFTKAVGLCAHGIGIGSFAYLRRIFEYLIQEAYLLASTNGDKIDSFVTLRMDEKILALKSYLPPFLVEHRSIYGIMSRGVHELNEQECLDYFTPVRNAIELILEEKLDEYKKKRKIEETSKAISQLNQKLSK